MHSYAKRFRYIALIALSFCAHNAFAQWEQITPDNELSLAANISFDTAGRYGAKGTFRIPDNFPNEIKQGAQFFANRDAQGVYQLDQAFQ